jgi:hypothetical protein
MGIETLLVEGATSFRFSGEGFGEAQPMSHEWSEVSRDL